MHRNTNNKYANKLQDITNHICEYVERTLDYRIIENNETYGLLTGNFGILIFLAYITKHNKSYESLYNRFLDYNLNAVSTKLLSPDFCSGISGIISAISFMNRNNLCDLDISEFEKAYEKHLYMNMIRSFAIEKYDYFYGGIGVALCFLNNLYYNSIYESYIEDSISILRKVAIEQNNMLKWKTSFTQNTQYTYNISISHGISSIIIFLCKCHIHGFNCKDMIQKGVEYILSQELKFEEIGSCFPSISKECEKTLQKSRLGWCYGDLGISIALLWAGKVLHNELFINKAKDIIALSVLRREYKDTFVDNPFICHGAAGLACIYYNFNDVLKIKGIDDAGDFWLNKCIEFGNNQNGVAGYILNEKHSTNDIYSILNGITGVGLTLLFHLYNDTDWTEFILLK